MGGVLLLLDGGGRPDAPAIQKIVENLAGLSVSLDPARTPQVDSVAPKSGQQAAGWLELLANGMTFDLVGLAPGPTASLPEIRHRIDLADDFVETGCEVICVLPGPHLSGGNNSLPVVRAMMGVASRISAQLAGVRAVGWAPSTTIMGPEFFRANAENWANGGPVPAPLLTGFKHMSDGGMQSEGLSFFTGQELRIEPGSVGDYPTATMLAGRLVQQLVQHGPLLQTEEVMAPDGSQMRLEPSGNGKFVRVWRS